MRAGARLSRAAGLATKGPGASDVPDNLCLQATVRRWYVSVCFAPQVGQLAKLYGGGSGPHNLATASAY